VRELPGDLKRFRSLRPQAVAARGTEVAAALDDSPLRALVLEWLDDRPTLSKKEAEVLRLAAARADGWEAEIEKRTPKSAKKGDGREAEVLRERVERERTKTADAREDARKAKEEARTAAERERRRTSALERELASTKKELQQARSENRSLQSEATKHKEARERDLRRERRDAERARSERDEQKEKLRAARRETTELRKQIRDLERRLASAERVSKHAAPRTATRAKARPKKRRPLKAPPGLFEEAAESLVKWLETPGVRVLIDGYNVTKAEEGFGDLHLPAQRNRLVQEVTRLARKYDVAPIIVFDGSDVPPGTRRRVRPPVEVEYSSADEIADDHLVARLDDLPPDPVIVVTNDRELQDRARAKGATIARSDQLLALVR
jgi:predicted RNA-binding protein with PIN domain